MNVDTLRGLLAAQFPDLADRPLTELPPKGTDHFLYRVGNDLVARLPRHAGAETQVDSDRWWLPRLAPHLPVPVPVPAAQGAPGDGYPWRWSIVPWIDGENPTRDNIAPDVLARDLAAFIHAMGAIDTTGGPAKTGITRGVPLARRDADGMTDLAAVMKSFG